MGRVYIRNLGDIRTKGLILRVTCGKCGRVAYYGADKFIQHGRGATILPWLGADDRERKRLLLIARN